MVEVDSHASVTLHRSTAAKEHRLLGQLHSLEGTIDKATGMVRGGRGREFRVAKGQNLDLVPIEVHRRLLMCDARALPCFIYLAIEVIISILPHRWLGEFHAFGQTGCHKGNRRSLSAECGAYKIDQGTGAHHLNPISGGCLYGKDLKTGECRCDTQVHCLVLLYRGQHGSVSRPIHFLFHAHFCCALLPTALVIQWCMCTV